MVDAGREAPQSLGTIENTQEAIRKCMNKLMDASADLEVFYEAGSTDTGFTTN